MTTVNIQDFADKCIDIAFGEYFDVDMDENLQAGESQYYQVDGKYYEIFSLIAFDFAGLPENQRIVSASMYLYKRHSNENDTGITIRYGSCPPFIEDATVPDLSTMQRTHSFEVTVANQWYNTNIIDLVNQAYNSAGKKLYLNFGKALYIDQSTAEYFITFDSRRGTNIPYVQVTYEALPPNPPTNLSPSSETKLNDQTIRFSWTHNPTQIGDVQSKFDLLWSSNGGSTWTTVSQVTANQYYDMPADTLPVENIIWKVRTYATSGLASEYSTQAAFVSAGKPATPVLTAPNATENTSTPVIAWTGTGQVMYQAQVLEGANVAWDSGEVASTIGQALVGTALADNTSYTAKVRIKNQYDLWSDWATKAFAIDFEVPNKPEINIVKDWTRFSSRFSITNPAPDSAGGFAYNEVYRREVGTAWIRIATNIERDSTYEDCAMKSGQPYEYKIRAIGTYGYMDSDIKFSDIKVKDSQLASLTNKSLYVPLRYDPQRNISIGLERTLMKFAGRPQPVAEFGEHIDKGHALSYVIESLANIEALEDLVESGETLLYRDNRGRKVFCTIGSIDIDELEMYWKVSFSIAEVSHQEEV